MLSGIDDSSMKHTFIISFPKELSAETFIRLKLKNKPVTITPVDEIF